MKLSNERKHLVLENQRLVHYLVQKLGVDLNSLDYEDIVSIGTIGLIKAAITFDTAKNIAFSTYASNCINNEIFMHYRKYNKYANNISIDEPLANDDEGHELTIADIIPDTKSDFVEKIINREMCINLMSIILNTLEGKQRIVLLYRIGSITQREIAHKLNISQSYVARIEAKATKEVKKKIASKQIYKEVFSIKIVGDEYQISFISSKDISKFNKIFAKVLQNLTSVVKVNYNREQVII